MKLYLSADADGTLTGIQLNESQPTSSGIESGDSKACRNRWRTRARESTEIEIGFDYDLRYEFVIGAVILCPYENDSDVVKLIEKIRFNTPEAPE